MRQRNLLAVRLVLEDHPEGLYPLQIMRRTRMLSGTLYPVLAHLEREGEITSERHDDGRRLYRKVVS